MSLTARNRSIVIRADNATVSAQFGHAEPLMTTASLQPAGHPISRARDNGLWLVLLWQLSKQGLKPCNCLTAPQRCGRALDPSQPCLGSGPECLLPVYERKFSALLFFVERIPDALPPCIGERGRWAGPG